MTFNKLFRRTVVGGLLVVVLLGRAIPAFAQTGRIEAQDTNYWRIWATAGHDLTVIVDGDGDTDLDCWARDGDGWLLASDVDITDYCILRFAANETGFVQIRIDNLGDVWNAYEIRVR